MVKQELDVLGSEISEDGNHDGLICVYCQIGHPPTCAVPCPKGDMLAFIKADGLEEKVELGDESGHLRVSERLAIDGVERGLVPELPGSLLEKI